METTLDSIRDIKIYQRKNGYRFSLDALLLFSFVGIRTASSIVDLGAGSGIIGILLAKKYPAASVTLLELQEGLFRLAAKNVEMNGLRGRVNVLKCDIRKLPQDLCGFDLAVSNPPFRRPLSGRLNIDRERAVARHEMELSLSELVRAASGLLKNGGRFVMIYHPARLPELINELKRGKLEPKRLRFVHGTMDAEAKMALVEAVKQGRGGLKVERPLVVYGEDGLYTDEIAGIYGTETARYADKGGDFCG